MTEGTKYLAIKRFGDGRPSLKDDLVTLEEPLEIRLAWGSASKREEKSISMTMRTPGNDFDLVLGFLFCEGIIKAMGDVLEIKHCGPLDEKNESNVVKVSLSHEKTDLAWAERAFISSSACGVCGKPSIEALASPSLFKENLEDKSCRVKATLLNKLPMVLNRSQQTFKITGGVHASAIFDLEGKLCCLKEDVGRHNAVDKVIGSFLLKNELPINERILLLSGRAGYELIQKSASAGIPIVASLGAPSSLAVEFAKENQVTLLGFLKEDSFNVYTHPERISEG